MQTGIRYGLTINGQPTELLPGDILYFNLGDLTGRLLRGGDPLLFEENGVVEYFGYVKSLDYGTCFAIASLVAHSHGYRINAADIRENALLFEFFIPAQ